MNRSGARGSHLPGLEKGLAKLIIRPVIVDPMAITPISIAKAKLLAQEKGLKPARVRDTGMIQFTRSGGSPRLEVIDWLTFEGILRKRGLAVYANQGWMKILDLHHQDVPEPKPRVPRLPWASDD